MLWCLLRILRNPSGKYNLDIFSINPQFGVAYNNRMDEKVCIETETARHNLWGKETHDMTSFNSQACMPDYWILLYFSSFRSIYLLFHQSVGQPAKTSVDKSH